MIKTKWIDPNNGEEFEYTWGYDFSGEIARKPFPRPKNEFVMGGINFSNFGTSPLDDIKRDILRQARKNNTEKEKPMRITDAKRADFDKMMHDFAVTNGLRVETSYESLKPNVHNIIFRKGYQVKEFVVFWDKQYSLTRAATPIFVELTRIWNLDNRDTATSVISGIKRVIFNDPYTIVLWNDDTKTIVKCVNEIYDPEKGLAMAISKKTLGNKGNYFETFKRWIPKKEPDKNEDNCEIDGFFVFD